MEAALENSTDHESEVGMMVGATFEAFLSTSLCAYSYPDRFLDSKRAVREDDRNVLILHSSGTTGEPEI